MQLANTNHENMEIPLSIKWASFQLHCCWQVHMTSFCCSGTKGCTDGTLRLMEGSTATEETVQYCHHGVWGWVCGDSWTAETATVACRQLGLPTSRRLHWYSWVSRLQNSPNLSGVFFNSYYKPLTDDGPFYLKSMMCAGTEDLLDRCVDGSLSNYGHWCSWRVGTGLNDYDYLVAELRCH